MFSNQSNQEDFEDFKINSFSNMNLFNKDLDLQSLDEIFEKTELLYKTLHENPDFESKFKLYRNIDLEFGSEYEIIALSDLHADIARFFDFLIKFKFIIRDGEINYNWNPDVKNKVIVICGDFIDGRRPMGRIIGNNTTLLDNNEIKLHVLLYNLRLEAIKYNNYILCTLGNHDFFAIHVDIPIKGKYIYYNYIDETSKKSYITLYKNYFLNILKKYIDKPTKNESLNKFYNSLLEFFLSNNEDNETLYLARSFILSRFYSIGYHFFLKVNDTFFAHAGLYKDNDVFELFEKKKENSNFIPSPELIQRRLLTKLSNSVYHIQYFTKCLKNKTSFNYFEFYKDMLDLTSEELYTVYSKEKIDNLTMSLIDSSIKSLVNRFFLTRDFQKSCKLKSLKSKYNCNLLVVGHCPTCSSDIFNPENVKDITSCDDARIVFSCKNKLVTVDIAFSSAFSPNKKFYEFLSIQKINKVKTIKVIRFNLDDQTIIEYNEKKLNNE